MSSRGSIDTYELKDGTIRYRARIYLNYDNGDEEKRTRKSKVFGSKQAAQLWLNKLSTQEITAVYIEPSNKTLREFLNEWLEYLRTDDTPEADENSFNGIAAATYAKYNRNVENSLIPKLGDVPLGKMSVGVVQDFVDSQLSDGRLDDGGKYSVSTIKTQVGTLRTALKQAKRLNLIRGNPAKFEKLDFPAENTRERKSLSPEQASNFVDAANKIGTYQPIYTTALFTGLRRSELLALTWDKVDLKEGVISVQQKMTTNPCNGEIFITEKTKTASSYRKVRVSEEITEILSEHNRDQLEKIEYIREENWKGYWEGERLVFTNETNGNWIYPSNLRRTLQLILDEAGITSDFQFHDLRSSYITLMHHLGANIEEISDAVGHSSSKITRQIYRGTVPGVQEEDANRFSEAILS